MTIETQEPKGRPPRWLYPLLIVSLAANLLIAGAVAGGMWRFRHHHGGGPGERGLMGFVRQLPSDRQAVLGNAIGEDKEKLKTFKQELQDGWAAVNAALGAEPFDKERLKAATAKTAEGRARMQAAIADALVELADKLTPNERKQLQAWHEKQRHMMAKRRHHRDGPDDGGPPPKPAE
jgi:uncharacterized membrane protein